MDKYFNGYRAYIMDTGAFADDGIYGRCLDAVSEYRRCKVERLRRRDDRNASLAAGILLAHALRNVPELMNGWSRMRRIRRESRL